MMENHRVVVLKGAWTNLTGIIKVFVSASQRVAVGIVVYIQAAILEWRNKINVMVFDWLI